MGHKTRVMYIEEKGGGFVENAVGNVRWMETAGANLTGPARIGRITYSKTMATIYYQGRALKSLKGEGKKSNYFDEKTGAHFWISGPKRNGQDALCATNIPVEIDEDAREEYWTKVRKKPELKSQKHT